MTLDKKDANELEKLDKTKPKLLIFGKKPSDFKRAGIAALPADRLGGRSGQDLAKVLGLGRLRKGQELLVASIEFPIDQEKYLGPVSLKGYRAQIFKNGIKYRILGFLQCEEKFRKNYLRKRLSDPIVWSTSDSRGVEYDAEKMHTISVQAVIESWAASGITLARVTKASASENDGKKGFFTHLKCIKGRTPQQMENILGFKSGYFREGIHVYLASPSQLSVSKVIMKGYTYLDPNKEFKKKLAAQGLTEETIAAIIKSESPWKSGDGVIQFVVKSNIAVKKMTNKSPLGYKDKL